MSGDPDQEYFTDGTVEDIITALSRIRWLFVIARNSSFTYKGQAVDVKQVGRELGVRYVLEGSVRKAGGRVRITAQLIEASSGAHLWADRALEINQSFARGWQQSGWLRLWAGQPDPAIEHFETSLRLSPREHRSNPFMGIGVGHFFAGKFEEARRMLLLSLQEKPSWVPTYRFLASCHTQMGRLEETREAVKQIRDLSNVVVPTATHWRNAEHRELYLSGLRLAAGETT